MEFWGVEVKPKETVKCGAELNTLLHLSQASLGEFKKDKKTENVPLFVKINEQKLVIGTLSTENCTQIQYDVVFEKEFELSHGSKDTSVFFVGYKSSLQDHGSDDEFSDFDSDEDIKIENKVTEKAMVKSKEAKPATVKVVTVKDNSVAAKAKVKTGKPDKDEKPKSDDLNNILDDDDDDEESEDDEEILKGTTDSDDEDDDDVDDDDDDDDDSSEDEAASLKKTENDKKRSADGVSKPSAAKKPRVATPFVKQKTGDAIKDSKAAAATPSSAKQFGKTPATGDKPKQQSAKSTGSFKCNSCNKPFNSDNALQSHTKAKHSAAK